MNCKFANIEKSLLSYDHMFRFPAVKGIGTPPTPRAIWQPWLVSSFATPGKPFRPPRGPSPKGQILVIRSWSIALALASGKDTMIGICRSSGWDHGPSLTTAADVGGHSMPSTSSDRSLRAVARSGPTPPWSRRHPVLALDPMPGDVQFDLAFCNGVSIASRPPSGARRRQGHGGFAARRPVLLLGEQSLDRARHVMSRIPFDRDAIDPDAPNRGGCSSRVVRILGRISGSSSRKPSPSSGLWNGWRPVCSRGPIRPAEALRPGLSAGGTGPGA